MFEKFQTDIVFDNLEKFYVVTAVSRNRTVTILTVSCSSAGIISRFLQCFEKFHGDNFLVRPIRFLGVNKVSRKFIKTLAAHLFEEISLV